MSGERRATLRRRVLKAGTIEFGGATISCSVRNFSASGAALDVQSPIGIPDRFIDHGKREILLDDAGLTPSQIAARVIRAAGRPARVLLAEG